MSDFNEKAALLAERLLELTVEGRVDWEPTGDDNTFAYFPSTNGPSVEIERYQYANRWRTALRIVNSDNENVENLVAGDTDTEPFHGRTVRQILLDLYKQARRIALHVDDVIDELMTELK